MFFFIIHICTFFRVLTPYYNVDTIPILVVLWGTLVIIKDKLSYSLLSLTFAAISLDIEMANQALLTIFLITAATVQVAFATYNYYYYPPCDPPYGPEYGGYSPYNSSHYPYGKQIKYYCDDGYKLDGHSWSVCDYDRKNDTSYWKYPTPECKKKSKLCRVV